mmetsp:Transcript_29339/g.44210  ORF Transcript_29339/g.44210 Transcript_29339/m.44210 type:complete len:279 (-) Transcript_29339:438-1274(-)
MVEERPFQGEGNADSSTRLSGITALSGEVPHAGNGGGHELLDGDDEGNDPEETEEEEPEEVGGLIFPLDSSDERRVFILNGTDAVQVDSTGSPPSGDGDAENVGHDGQESNVRVGAHELTSSLHDRGSKSNVGPLAADEERVNSGEHPDQNGDSLGELLVLGLLLELVVVLLEPGEIAYHEAEHKDQEQRGIKQGLGDPSQEEQVEQSNHERSEAHDQEHLPGFGDIGDVGSQSNLLVHLLIDSLNDSGSRVVLRQAVGEHPGGVVHGDGALAGVLIV